MQLKYIPNLSSADAQRIEAEMSASNLARAWVWRDCLRWHWAPLNSGAKGAVYLGSIGGE